MDKNIVISIKTVIYTLLIFAGVYIVYELGKIIGIIFIALLLAISLERVVKFFMSQKLMNKYIHRSLAVLLTYLIVFAMLAGVVTVGYKPVVTQTQKLIQTLIDNQEVFILGGNVKISISEIVSGFVTTSDGVIKSDDFISTTKSIFGNFLSISSVMVLSIYFSLDWENIKSIFLNLFEEERKRKTRNVITEIELNVGHWLIGEMILMLVIGTMSFIGLSIVGVKFALALAIIAGLLEIVPTIGPLISAVVAFVVAFPDSIVKALVIVAVFILIQSLENNLIVPKVMQKASGFRPVVILIAILAGNHLFGILGAVIAVPVLMIGTIIFKHTVFSK